MDTERPSPRYSDIDLWAPLDVIDAMIEGQFAAVAAVRAARLELEQAALAAEARLKAGGRLAYAGAGTSGRLAVQDGAELMPTFGWPRDRLLLFMAGGEDALTQAAEGAEDQAGQAIDLVRKEKISANDVMIAVAASGATPFTLACLREAGRLGACTIGIANNPATPLLEEAERPICLATGPEPIAGSTRMNAGTAQRIALSVLSSLVMIRLGRVYRGLMVDMLPSNAKLLKRQLSMLVHLTGRSGEEVAEALRRANGSVKLAVLLLEGCDVGEARRILDLAGGRLRQAVSAVAAGRGSRVRHADFE